MVNTRHGIFGAGGYGGGLFDGSMAVGGLGRSHSPRGQRGIGALYTAGQTNSTVKFLQGKVNDALEVFGCTQLLTEDGLIGTYSGNSKTCGALAWLLAANQATGLPLPNELLTVLNGSAHDDIVNSCASFTPVPPTCSYPVPALPEPTAPLPGPSPTVALDPGVVWMAQVMMNDLLTSQGIAPIREDGVMDSAVCGALEWMILNQMAGNVQIDQALLDLLSANAAPLEAACAALKPWTPPSFGSGTPTPTPIPEDDYVECYFIPGTVAPQVSLLQEQINQALDTAGYEPIPVTGVYDAETCGAIFELGGNFTIKPSVACPAGWEIPLECPDAIAPVKKGARKKLSTAAMIGIGAIIASVVGAGLYAAKKARA